jgi:DNA-binding NtrC family response regulator
MSDREGRRGRILVVEDEGYVRDSLAEILRARGYEVETASAPPAAVAALERAPVDVVLSDLKMPAGGGLELLKRIRMTWPELPVVILTGFGTVGSAVECLRAGASDYVLKPTDPDALEVALERAMESRALKREVAYLRRAEGADDEREPIGESPAWQATLQKVRAAAATDATVLLTGESGTGKDVLARLVHRASRRARAPYVRVNCAAVPLEIWESEFFGHRKGSYTGATADRDGRFVLAHRGTLFMDEVGAMPLAAQAKMLRVLQDGEFDRVGDERPTRVDVRLIAATNSDLEAEVKAGRFRQDLFYRLNVVRVEVPPLRRRREDVPLLVARFVEELAARHGRPAPALDAATLSALAAYPWPGNVRELRNVIERALILSPADRLDVDLSPTGGAPDAGLGAAPAEEEALNLRVALGRREREVLVEALRRSGGVRKEAARLLGIDQRNLGYYLNKHAIDPDAVDAEAP